jgi:PAS domain S-box-containing protein
MSSSPVSDPRKDLLRCRFDADADGRAVLDADGRWLLVNPSLCTLLGRSEEELVGRTWDSTLDPAQPGSFAAMCRKPPETAEAEVRFGKPDGGTFTARVLLTAFAKPDSGETLHEATIGNVGADEPGDRLWRICDGNYHELFDASFDLILVHQDGLIVAVNDSGVRLMGVASPAEMIGLPIDHFVPSEMRDESPARMRLLVRSSKVFPRHVQQVQRPDGTTFDAECIGIPIRHLGRQAVLMLVRNITDSLRAERALAESEHWFRALADLSPVGIYRTDNRGACLYVNPTWCRFSGMTPEEAAGEGWQRGMHPADRQRIFDLWKLHAEDLAPWNFEYRFLTPAGKVTWVAGTSVALRNEGGGVIGYLGVNIDITERKAAEEALVESENRLRIIAETIPQVFWIVSPDWREVHYISPSYENVWGRTCRSLIEQPQSWMEAVHPLDRKTLEDAVSQKRGNGIEDPAFPDYRVVRPDGSVRWIRARAFPVRGMYGKVRLVAGMAEDITERKAADEARRLADERYRQIVVTANEGIWMTDEQHRTTFVNPQMAAMLGYTPDEMLGRTTESFMSEDELGGHAEQMRLRHTGASSRYERRFRCRDGSRVIWTSISGAPIIDAEGKFAGAFAMVTDITEQKKAAMELKDREGFLNHVLTTNPGLIYIYDLIENRNIYANRSLTDFLGYSTEDVQAMGSELFARILHPDDAESVARHHARLAESSENLTMDLEYRMRASDGSWRWLWSRDVPFLRDPDGSCRQILGFALDVTHQHRSEDELLRSRTHLEEAQRVARVGSWEWDVASGTIFWSEELYRLNRRDPSLGPPSYQEMLQMYEPEHRLALQGLVETAVKEGKAYDLEYHRVFPDGSIRHFLARGNVGRGAHGEVNRLYGTVLDVTERKRREQELGFNEAIFRNIPDGILVIGARDGAIRYANERIERMFGYDRDELLGKDVACLNAPTDHSPEETKAEIVDRLLERGEWHGEIRNIRKDGTRFWSHAHVAVCDHPDFGQVFLSVHSDISQQKETEEILRQNRHFLDRILQTSPNLVYIFDLHERWNVYSNRELLAFLGYDQDQIRESGSQLFASILHPEDADRLAEHYRLFDAAGADKIFEVEYRVQDARGEWRWLRSREVLFSRAPDGSAREILGVAEDVTARRKTDLERIEMERRLLQSQKLESLGVMAGGIAHDFNNLLMAILGNLEMSIEDTPADSPTRPGLEQAIQATVKAAALTDQMLAYAGHGSTNPVLVDLNKLIRQHAPLLRTAIFRTVGLTLALSPEPANVAVDAGQMQQVVMNLVANASEAIDGKSGEIRISTGMVDYDQALLSRSRLDEKPSPGRFVRMEVTDDGCGMDESTLQRLFDPFFSTKFTGRGLGMASVLGIVRAHKGAIMVDSLPGRGTAVTILLPAALPAVATEPTRETARPETLRPPARTVLVADDEQPVRDMIMAYLHRLGFETLGAADGEEAVAVFREHADDIVCALMDLTMPRRNGIEAAAELRALRPDVPVILCSGFDEASARNIYGDYGVTDFIKKPCSLVDLKRKISSTLDRPT